MAASKHTHRAVEKLGRGPYGYNHCVAPHHGRCNPMAHGGVMYVQVCLCGAERRINSTGAGRTERGEWTAVEVAR
jgi:hypothetical protein